MSGTITAYAATGSIATAKAQATASPILNLVVTQFQEDFSDVPAELANRPRDGEQSIKAYKEEIDRRETAARITLLITTTNQMFRAKMGAVPFREDDPRLVSDLHSPCMGEGDFVVSY